MKPEIILIGGGGHCKSCIDVVEQENKFKIKGIVDVEDKIGKWVLGYEIFATDGDIAGLVNRNNFFLITLGQIKNPTKRIKIFNLLKNLNAQLPTIISPRAYVSNHSQIGQGTIIMHDAVINA
jgi:hypothetical protein